MIAVDGDHIAPPRLHGKVSASFGNREAGRPEQLLLMGRFPPYRRINNSPQ